MKKALISPAEQREAGFRVAEVSDQAFDVAEPFFWVDCPDTLTSDSKWYDPVSATFKDFAVPAPAPATSTTPLQFIERFTDAEQLAIVTAAMQSPQLRLWYDKLMAAQEVVFSDLRLAAGMNALVAAGLITPARSEEILPLSLRGI